MKKDRQQKILERLTNVGKLYDSLKAEYSLTNEEKIVDMIVGNKPIIQHLRSLECKEKGNGELLLGEKDWPAIIDALRKSMPQQEIPIEKVLKTNVTTLSTDKSEEQMKLLEQIVILLSELVDTYIVLVDFLSQE